MKASIELTLLCIIKFIALILIALFSLVALAPDEAQYWTWSQALDFGYYSKPPAISWQIFLTTLLFGNNELGVRMGAMLIGTCLTLAIYFLAKAATLPHRTALISAAIFTLSPMGFYLSFAATTDGGSILFMTLALLPIVKALAAQAPPRYWLVGFFVALGALYKWTIFLLWPLLGISLLFFPLLRKKSFLTGVAVSLLGLLPSLYWNMSHEWATYKHVFATLFVHTGEGSKGNFFDYLGAQIALFSPLFFLMLIYSTKKIFNTQAPPLRFLSLFLAAAGAALVLSSFKKMQVNWALYFYPPLMILIGWIVVEKMRFFLLATTLSVAAIVASLLIPKIQAEGWVPLSYKLNPYRQNMGVRAVGELLQEVGYEGRKDFLFADKYQNASLLSFYSFGQKRAYFFNLGGSRKNQFSYWEQMSKVEKGNRGYFVVIENRKERELDWYKMHYQERLDPYFTSISYAGSRELFTACGEGVKYALIFKCEGYLGGAPLDPEKY